MCGICGICNFANNKPVEEKTLRQMCEVMKHRGPDDEGYYLTQLPITNYQLPISVGLGIRRLAIIDLKTGHQPIHNEDKKIWIVCNGEIYNFPELREILEKKGHRFYTKTDTETIVHLYEDYGVNCLDHLRGMFAFALWDNEQRQLFLARDRIGKKPLCYTIQNGSLIFASEIKSILENPEIKREVNLEAIHLYLTYQYIPSPLTAFRGINKLPPASYLLCDENGNLKIEHYWNLSFRKKLDITQEEAKEKIYQLLKEATKIRLISDVPLGAFLSGGHDSSIIVGLMAEEMSKPVKTFSIGFEEEDFSELNYARIVAKHFGTDHHEFILRPETIEILPKIVWHCGEPFADTSALPTYQVAKITQNHVTVVLNGDGGDENFAGYLRYPAMKVSELISKPIRLFPKDFFRQLVNYLPVTETVKAKYPSCLARLAAKRAGRRVRYMHRFLSVLTEPAEKRNVIWHCFFTNELKYWIYSQGMKEQFIKNDAYEYLSNVFLNAPANDTLDQTFYTDIMTYLPEDLLVKMDVATMSNSLEARAPFLDYKLLEFTASLPAHWKLHGITTKYILKKTFKDFLPKEIVHRGKQGFGIPVGKWLRYDLKDYLKEIILSSQALKRGYFRKEAIEQLVNEHIQGYRDHGYRLWALLVLELWHRIFIDKNL